MTIILDLLLISVGVYYASTGFVDNELVTYTTNLQDYRVNYSSGFESTTPDTETTILERTFGDTKFAGLSWWSLFKAGIAVPQSCSGGLEDTCPQIEQYLMRGYTFSIVIINLLLVFEGFLLLYTKKNT